MAARVFVSWILGIIVLLCQAIYTFRTGQTRWFFARPPRSNPLSWEPRRNAYGLVYLISAVGMMVALMTELIQVGIEPVFNWVIRNFAMFLWSLCFLLIGLQLLIQPEKMLRRTIRDNPELADYKSTMIIARFIGVGLFGMGLAILGTL